MSLPEPLRFTVSLIDQISAPVAGIQQSFGNLTDAYSNSIGSMVGGAGAMLGAGMAIYSALEPAIQMENALAKLGSSGIAESGLNAIRDTALRFSSEFGVAAVDVVAHAEQIRTYMGNLPDEVLVSTARASATLAMAMQSDAETTGRYLKNLYNNFRVSADAMGVDTFTQKVVGMTAKAKALFGTSMTEMESMIDGMHSLTSTLGVDISDQFSVLGTLSMSMSSGDAVAQYTNFLEGAAGAQEKLGVKLTDDAGNLLHMMDVIDAIAPKLDGLSGIESRTLLDEAGLGDGALMLINMIKNADQFKESYHAINVVNGIDNATHHAQMMISQFERLGAGINNIKIAFGSVLLPVLLPIVQYLSEISTEIIILTQLFPNITRYIGYATLSILGLAISGGAISLMVGVFKMAWATIALGAPIITALSAALTWMRGAILAVNIVMAVNPLGLMVVGIVAAIAAISSLVIYWDDLKSVFSDVDWLGALMSPLKMVIGMMSGMFDSLKSIGSFIGFGDDDELAGTKINALQQTRPSTQVQAGGLMQQMSSMNKTTHMGGVSIYPINMNNPNDFASEMEMIAG